MPDLPIEDTDGIRLETTPAGPTVSIRTPDGRWVRLHSGRDPVAEAERRVAGLMAGGDPPLIICIGLGLGYILDAIERRSSATRVLALEPLPAVSRAMRSRRSWEEWLTSGRLTLLVGPGYAGAAAVSHGLADALDAPIMVDPVLDREFANEVAVARAVVKQAIFGARANAEARRTFAPGYVVNTIRNTPVIAASADVSALDDAFTGMPAIVIAAGPSLDRNIEELRHVRSRALLIAVDTALRPLLEAGIEPEFVVSLDPSEINGRHLRNLPDPAHTWLVGEGSLAPAAFEQFAGRTFVFSVSDHHPWPWLRSIGLGRGRLRAWGSVITSAFDLALRAGCNPIVFSGADLSFPEGRPYCRGTIYDQDWATRAAGGESLTDIWQSVIDARAAVVVDDVAGRPVGTTAPLLAFRDWLVEQSAGSGDRRIVNATGGGSLVGGRIEQRTLLDALDKVSRPRSPGIDTVRAAWARGRRTGQPGHLALERTLAGLAETPGQDEPIASWLEFGSPDLTLDAVRDALLRAAKPPVPEAASPFTLRSPVAGLGYPPERVIVIRDAMIGHSNEGCDGTNPEPPATALARASSLMVALLRSSSVLDEDHPSIVQGEVGRIPSSRAFCWSASAGSLVLRYETALAEMVACGDAAGDADVRAALDRLQVTLDADGSIETDASATPAAPHLALLADWLSLVANWDAPHRGAFVRDGRVVPLRVAAALVRAHAEALRPDPEAPLSQLFADALTGALVRVPPSAEPVPVPPMRLPALSIALPTGSTPEAVPLSLSIHARYAPPLTGWELGPSWLRAAHAERPCGWVTPLRLTGPDLATCMVGNRLDDSHALFTISNGSHSVRIDASGRWEPDAPWPGLIVGQVLWGATGAIAWHNAETSRVMWRERPDGNVSTETMPFSGLAYPQADGSILWTSAQGGLWSWTPGGAWQQLVETPPVRGLQLGADGIRLDPRGENPSFAVRERLTEAFLWQPGSDAVRTIALGPEGPCWSTSSNGDWTALAHPHADVVLLRHRDGLEQVLHCAYPFSVAWAGPSLAVSTGRGELLLFRDLVATLNMDR